VRHVEAQAAQLWWRQWAGFELKFKGPAPPEAWRVFQSRYIGRPQGKLGELAMQFTARNAIHPMHAMHNYAITVLVARIARVVIAKGLDPCFGFLHDGRKPGRLSLCWDMVELWRPTLARTVFEFATKRKFRKDDFVMFEQGIVRLSAPLAKDVAALAKMVEASDWLRKLL
jgi:CRISP-associated protein Cas1